MAKALIVHKDPVSGKDSHKVTGSGTTPNGTTVSSTWTGSWDYKGTVTEALADWVTIREAPVAVDNSGSTLSSGHEPDEGAPYQPQSPVPTTSSLDFDGTVGPGTPSTGAGSTFVTVEGRHVLLDGDTFDTCGSEKGTKNSTVSADGQAFVTASE